MAEQAVQSHLRRGSVPRRRAPGRLAGEHCQLMHSTVASARSSTQREMSRLSMVLYISTCIAGNQPANLQACRIYAEFKCAAGSLVGPPRGGRCHPGRPASQHRCCEGARRCFHLRIEKRWVAGGKCHNQDRPGALQKARDPRHIATVA